MASYESRYWLADGSGVTRKHRQSCEYHVYIPDKLADRTFVFDGDVAADIADAEAAIIRLNAKASSLVDTETLARLLLRAESVASSRIEGLEIGARRLLQADAAREFSDVATSDVTAEEVLANIDAMIAALSAADGQGAITLDTLLGIHERLLSGTSLREHAGRIREEQNWIGGNRFNPCAAAFVPPPQEMVEPLLIDLCEFCNDDMLPATAQAAIAHAQFETIHPFVDGNGRTGRALIHLLLRRRGLAPRVVPPVSLVLATLSADYVGALDGFRHDGAPSSPEAMGGANHWIALFAGCCTRAVDQASAFEQRAREIQASWRERVGRVRRGSTADLLIGILPGAPVITAQGAARLTGRSFQAANEAIALLEEKGVLARANIARRGRAFEAREIIDAFTQLERQLASPAGDTAVASPTRPVPQRSR
jgi:Fic family protein